MEQAGFFKRRHFDGLVDGRALLIGQRIDADRLPGIGRFDQRLKDAHGSQILLITG